MKSCTSPKRPVLLVIQLCGKYLHYFLHFIYCKNMEYSSAYFFGQALVGICKRRGISPHTLAERSGISEYYISAIEKSQKEPGARMIVRLGRALGIPPGELVNEMDRLMREAGE
ncbi:MAG: helix-turn-helix transcriptional regulator [Desulfovibrionaceae bacterium]|nr:helix-turn-helix transcriptional regulator [Desulfovibrionaceae bacterium]